MRDEDTRPSRRDFTAGVMGAAGATVLLAACRPFLGREGGPAGPGAPGEDTGTAADTGGAWASGGTASMRGGYPDPFVDEPADGLGACALTCAMTAGPCYAQTLERRDISEGYPGLPMRLALRVVDDACKPVAGAVVDVWHTSAAGVYSGDDAIAMCTREDPDAEAHRFFRGIQTTDANGRVDFDTCLPGWYSGRPVHIHFTVRRGGDEHVTAQFIFDDALVAEICATHPDYVQRGEPDTWNTTDGIVRDAIPEATLATARMDDGAMLAWKTIVIRSSLETEGCRTGGRGPLPF